MSITRLFDQLGAPLTNPQWSWGAQRANDGAVFLRVWQDERRVEEGRLHFLILGDSDTAGSSPRLGYSERLRHIDAVRAGAPCFLVMLIAKDTASARRQLADFDADTVFVAGQIIEREGRRLWAEVIGRKPVHEVAAGRLGVDGRSFGINP